MLALIATVLISLPWFSDSADQSPQPVVVPTFSISPVAKSVREFMRLGDAALSGNAKAIDDRRALAQKIAKDFLAAPAATWETENDCFELMRFVLFGGSAEVLKRALESGRFPERLAQAAKGLVAFSERRLDIAREYLIDNPGESLPGHIEDGLALIKGALLSAKDPATAIEYLRRAQVAAPGTALEEAAIRQHATTLIRQGRTTEALERLKVYVRRYPNSIYWPQFGSVAALGVSKSTDFDAAVLSALEEGVTSASSIQRVREFKVMIGKQLVLLGSFEAASAILGAVSEKLGSTSEFGRAAKMYKNLADAVGSDPRRALQNLEAIDASQLRPDERALVQAGIEAASDVLTGYSQAVDVPEALNHSRRLNPNAALIQALPDELDGRAKNALELAGKRLVEVRP